ncbi:hypothetical protein PENSPDRAFT_654179 [Peniophora sp. CONT]|nr:hypothetical protein PENSPDRAFT_654179 [Peniophora sp. CONT]
MAIASNLLPRRTVHATKSTSDDDFIEFPPPTMENDLDQDVCEICEKRRQATPALFECRVVQAHGLPSRLGHSVRHAKYVAQVSIGGVKKETRTPGKGEDPVWDETIFSSIPVGFGGIPVTVRIIGIRHMHEPEIVATKALIVDLRREVPLGEDQRFVWSLDRKRGSNEDLHQPQDTTLEVCFARVDAKRARKPTCLEGPRPGGPTGAPTPAWSRLLRVGASAVRAVDGIVDIYPYVTLALKLLSCIPRVAQERIELDEQTKELRDLISDVLSFVEESKPLKLWSDNHDGLQLGILARIGHQIADCCRFLRAYADEACQWNDIFKKSVGSTHTLNIGAHVQRYKEVVKQLMAAFRDHTVCDIDVVIPHLFDSNEETGSNRLISSGSFQTSSSSSTCRTARNTLHTPRPYSLLHSHSIKQDRTAIFSRSAKVNVVDYIQKWIENPPFLDDARAILVIGEDKGASSVAHEIATQYSNMGRLASSFTFNTSDRRGIHYPPELLVRNLARDLADFDEPFASAMRASIVGTPDIAISSDCSRLFEHLVQKPAAQLSVAGPVVVVIDGLDFKGTRDERMELPEVLAEQFKLLPANFRFVLTMKTDHDVESVLAPAVEILRF